MWTFLNIAIVMALCTTTFGIFHGVLHRRGVGYVCGWGWTTLYFLAFAAVAILLYGSHLAPLLANFSWTPFIALGVFLATQAAAYVIAPRYLPDPSNYLATYPHRDYLHLDWRRIVSKSADILVQQVFIALLTVFLVESGLSLVQTTFTFLGLFALLHIPLLATEWGRWPMWAFGGAVVVFGLTFPTLILTVPYGFVYAFIIHWAFYTVSATIFWLLYVAKRHSTP